ncbi:MAG: hypothetical protein ACR2QK_14110 [Acidimicrobiales bacterium]
MEALASAFPLLVFVASLALAFFALRLNRRLSRGAQSAGPREVVRPDQVGLQQTPWELKAIDDQIRVPANSRARGDLVQTINRLTRAAGVTDPAFLLPPNASDPMIANVILLLERRLELPPLLPLQPDQRLGSADR